MNKILITGGAGYIGSILSDLLLNNGFEVAVADNFLYGQASLNHMCSNPAFNVAKVDVRDIAAMTPLYNWADIIIPLAALVGAPMCKLDPVGARTINHDSVSDMLKILSQDQLLLMPTTNSAYGTGDENNFCDEQSELKPISQYAIDKVEIEKEVMDHPNSISFRLATVFGMSPRMRTDLLVNDFVLKAFRDGFVGLFEGHFKRNYIHVRDVASAFLHGIANFESMKNNIFNVGLSDANLSKIELCQLIQKQISNFRYYEAGDGKDPDQRNYIVSNAKIEATGYRPAYSVEDGIRELIIGYTTFKANQFGNI